MIQGQTARDVQLLSDQAQVQPAAAAVEVQDVRSKNEMKRRVLFLSGIIALYVVVNALVQYVFDAAAIETALEQIRSVTNVKGGPILAKLLLRMIPGVTVSIILGLLVPFCGYIGAQQDSQGLVGCFCCCNGIHCGCASLGFITMVIIIVMFSAATPGIESYLEACDPVQCSQIPADISAPRKQALIVDCLAAGTWPDQYQQRFPGNARYPDICPKVMLKCKEESDPFPSPMPVEPTPWLRGGPTGAGGPYLGLGGSLREPLTTLRPAPPAWADPDREVPEPLPMEDDVQAFGVAGDVLEQAEAASHDEDDEDEGPPGPPEDRRLQSFTGHGLPGFDADGMPAHGARMRRSWRELPTWDDSGLTEALGPMPRDPIASCKPDRKGMKVIHQASLLLPELMPKLLTFMAVKLLLVVPVIILSCLGFWWGSDLYGKLGQGYGQLDNNRVPVVAPHVEAPPLPVAAVQAQPSAPAVQAPTVAVDRAE